MTFNRTSGFIVLLLLNAMSIAPFDHSAIAAVWQWSIVVRGARDNAGDARAFLWIPPNCNRVRGVLFAQHNMEEQSIFENQKFRAAIGQLNLAEVWCAPRWDLFFHFNEGAGETLEGILNDLADASGYNELKTVPWVGVGHSAAASMPYYLAAWKPERTLACISVSGQWPYVRGSFAPEIWGERTIDFIPALESMGEYEAANTWSTEGLKERQEHPLMPLSMLANPAQGHFASTEAKEDYLALYLKKVMQYRLPNDVEIGAGETRASPDNQPLKLNLIDPTKTGWLVDKWRFNQSPVAAPAPVDQYTGDPKQAFWFFDEELARATEKYESAYQGLKPQLIGYVQDGELVPQRNEHLQINLKFQPQADGITFRLTGAFYDTVPGGSPRPVAWTGLREGSPIGHASGGGPISIDRICGPFEKIAPDTFSVRLQRETTGHEKQYELVFAATHPGDEEYKPAVQQAHMFIPGNNTQGAEQHISFPEIPHQKLGTSSVKLAATSDANVPVYYYVREGPAEVNGDTLQFTPLPPRSKFPVKVTVVAWQYGRSVEPQLKTADPIEQTFLIVK
ncbi:MAG TPA: hypothetical protein VMJ32_18345 [Pirellulales bacterium]|nr:hypothetical protein [Pirellulales bacterium]